MNFYNGEFKEGADKAFVDQHDATFLALLAIEKAGVRRSHQDGVSPPCGRTTGEKVGSGHWAQGRRP